MRQYSEKELRELKELYDESGEAFLDRDDMRALKDAGLLHQGLPPAPKPAVPESDRHEDTLADYQAIGTPEDSESDGGTYAQVYACWKRLATVGRPTERAVADELGKSTSTIHHHIRHLVEDGYLKKDPLRERDYVLTGKPFTPVQDQKAKRSPDTLELVRDAVKDLQAEGKPYNAGTYSEEIARRIGKKPKTVLNKFPTLRQEGVLPKVGDPFRDKPKKTKKTIVKKPTEEAKETTMTNTAVQEQKPQSKPEEPRSIIANALVGIFDAVSALQRTAFQANDKVVYQFATKLLTGELMDIKANYSKDAAK